MLFFAKLILQKLVCFVLEIADGEGIGYVTDAISEERWTWISRWYDALIIEVINAVALIASGSSAIAIYTELTCDGKIIVAVAAHKIEAYHTGLIATRLGYIGKTYDESTLQA